MKIARQLNKGGGTRYLVWTRGVISKSLPAREGLF
jgi:hypothetical protein